MEESIRSTNQKYHKCVDENKEIKHELEIIKEELRKTLEDTPRMRPSNNDIDAKSQKSDGSNTVSEMNQFEFKNIELNRELAILQSKLYLSEGRLTDQYRLEQENLELKA